MHVVYAECMNVQQMIENLHARVQVGCKILLALRKTYMHLCKCKIEYCVMPIIFERVPIQDGLKFYKKVQNDHFLPVKNVSNPSKWCPCILK